MASRAVTKVRADWDKLAAKFTKSELIKLNKLKSQTDATYVRAVSLPDSLPKIDWDHYKKHAADPKAVEAIQKSYNTIKIDRPKAKASRLAELQKAELQDEERHKRFGKICDGFIHSSSVVKKKFEDMIPIPEMSIEDWALTFPEWSISHENPSIWPHMSKWPGLTREQARVLAQPDPVPFATPTAWKEWETRYKKFYED